jgi:hypothetical protein
MTFSFSQYSKMLKFHCQVEEQGIENIIKHHLQSLEWGFYQVSRGNYSVTTVWSSILNVFLLLLFCFAFVGLWFELKALCLQRRLSTNFSHTSSPFYSGYFGVGVGGVSQPICLG